MSNPQRDLLRAAVDIDDRLRGLHSRPPPIHLPEPIWGQCQDLARKITTARSRHWNGAVSKLSRQLRSKLVYLDDHVERLVHDLAPSNIPPEQITAGAVYRELRSLGEEFDEVRCNCRSRTLAVVTDPVVLQGIYLGPFRITLDWGSLGSQSPYEVVAMEPNTAAGNEETTHPHVQNDRLCEGEGHVSIQKALDEGRLCDFFLIVRQILTTYNQSSAFTPLSDWNSVSCWNCGQLESHDGIHSCQSCEVALCGECTVDCRACNESHCGECLRTCPECHHDFCPSCVGSCQECDAAVCEECQSNEQCKSCRARTGDADESQPSVPAEASAYEPAV